MPYFTPDDIHIDIDDFLDALDGYDTRQLIDRLKDEVFEDSIDEDDLANLTTLLPKNVILSQLEEAIRRYDITLNDVITKLGAHHIEKELNV